MLNGGIIGALLDCHSNWTAAYFLMREMGETKPPCTVTAFFNVTLKRPTPSRQAVDLTATVKELKADRALIEAKLFSNDALCATCEGLFVAVKAGHPAFHRW
jgi:acyl-coenzyme A thioesterase PaaI-like protein